MTGLLKQLGIPLLTIKEDPWKFTSWLFLLISFGLIGVWIPFVDNIFLNTCSQIPSLSIILSGTLSTFSTVILVEGLSSLINVKPVGKSKLSKGLKSVTFAMAILVFTLNVYLYGKSLTLESIANPQLLARLIIISGILSILLSTYLFCFRETNWEVFADDYVASQDNEIKDTTNKLTSTDSDNPLPRQEPAK